MKHLENDTKTNNKIKLIKQLLKKQIVNEEKKKTLLLF